MRRPVFSHCVLLAAASLTLSSCGALDPSEEASEAALEAALSGGRSEAEPVEADEDVTAQALSWDERRFLGSSEFRKGVLPATEIEPALDEADIEAQFAIGEALDVQDWAEAARVLAERMDGGHGARLDFLLGDLLVRQERLDEAIRAFENATDKHPNYVNAWRQLGNLRYRQGDFEGAVAPFSRVIALGRAGGATYGVLGICHAKAGDFVSAESAFRMATMLEPTSTDWKMGLGETLARQKRFADAAALFGGLLEQSPDRAPLWLAQGEAYARLGKKMEAAQNFEMAFRLGGASAGTLFDLGSIYAAEGLYALAVDAYQRAMAQNPDGSPDRALRVAAILASSGVPESKTLLDAIQEAYGDRIDTEQQKTMLNARARLAFRAGSAADEAALLEKVVALDPLDGDALLQLGDHARRTEQFGKAKSFFERAAAIEEFEPDALVGHARVLVTERDYAAAVPLLKRAQTLKERAFVEEFLERVQKAARAR